jgi:hypothetical protein
MTRGLAETDKKVDVLAQRFDVLYGQVGTQGIAIAALDKRVGTLETVPRRPSPAQGTPAVSISPPPGKPTDTGTWNVKQEWVEDIQTQVADLHAAREKAEDAARIEAARRRGAEEALAAAAADAEAKRQAAIAEEKRSRERLAIRLSAAGLAFTVLVFLLTHFLHL